MTSVNYKFNLRDRRIDKSNELRKNIREKMERMIKKKEIKKNNMRIFGKKTIKLQKRKLFLIDNLEFLEKVELSIIK